MFRYGEPDEIVKKNLELLKQDPDKFHIDTFSVDKKGNITKGQSGQQVMAIRGGAAVADDDDEPSPRFRLGKTIREFKKEDSP